jgi:hypothetical protein
MHKKIYLVFIALFFLFCLALISGVGWSLRELQAYREEYNMLESERLSSEKMMANMENKKLDLSQITGLNIDNSGNARDAVEFYAYVRQVIEDNDIELISMQSDPNTENLLTLQLQGSYYAIAHVFADWRLMPFASRINSLNIKRDNESPTSFVDAQVVLEALMEAKPHE